MELVYLITPPQSKFKGIITIKLFISTPSGKLIPDLELHTLKFTESLYIILYRSIELGIPFKGAPIQLFKGGQDDKS